MAKYRVTHTIQLRRETIVEANRPSELVMGVVSLDHLLASEFPHANIERVDIAEVKPKARKATKARKTTKRTTPAVEQ